MSAWALIILVLGIFAALMAYDRLSPRFQSVGRLRAYLRQTDPLYFRNALKELSRRGEDIKEEVVPILHLVVSDSEQHRTLGWLILKEIYPDLASRVSSFNPRESVEVCREKMQSIFLSAQQSPQATAAAPGS
jgi:hypothetical protein